jgi:hypothetical protein
MVQNSSINVSQFPQPITQREIRKTIPVSPGRHRLEKVRDKNDVERRRQWINESMPPFLGCVCKAHILAFCICPDMAQGVSSQLTVDFTTLTGKLQPRVFSTLPPEIVQQIFDMFIPPETLLDPSLHCGPNSAWCNAMVAKRALVLVSKDWYDVSVIMPPTS